MKGSMGPYLIILTLENYGCLCYATSVGTRKDNFQERAIKLVMIGYANTHKAYKLYNITDKCLFISKDVVFHESIFLFQNNNDSEGPVIPLPMVKIDFPESQPCQSSPVNNGLQAYPSPRRTQRVRQRPIWMHDYVNCLHTTILYFCP